MNRIKYVLVGLVFVGSIISVSGQSISAFRGEVFEQHIHLDWEFPSGQQVSNFRIYRSVNNGPYEELVNIGQNSRTHIDWLGEVTWETTYDYYIRRILAGQEGPSSDTLNFSVTPMSDDRFMDMVQKYTLRYFWDFGHPVSGMARERNTSGDIVTTGGTGFGIMAMLAGADRGFLDREAVLNRLIKIVSFLQFADRFKGAFPHWMDGRTGRTVPFSSQDDGADLVETAFLIEGLLCARQYFNGDDPQEQGLRQIITGLYEDVEWSWFRRGNGNVLFWHWSPVHEWAINLPIRGFDEAMMVYLLAVASPTHPVPPSMYHTGWAGGNYINSGIHFGYPIFVGPLLGGPMFFAHYSFIGLDPRERKDQYCNYFERNRNHALIQQAYCRINPLNHPGYSEESWGLTASDNPWGYLAHEPTGSRDNGTIAPTAALASMPYTPEASMLALKHFYREYGEHLWGEYGFHDAFNIGANWFASSYLAIDQGPIVGMIENHRTGLLWSLFMANPEIEPALEALGFEADPTSIREKESESYAISRIFPSQVEEEVRYEMLQDGYVEQITIFTVGGQVYFQEEKNRWLHQSEVHAVTASNLPAGIYFMRLQYKGGSSEVHKFIKK